MVYQRVSKPSFGNSQIYKKDSPSTAPTISVQAKSDSASPQEQEMPIYTPLAANWATNNNLMRSMSGAQVVQRQEELGEEKAVQQKCEICQEENESLKRKEKTEVQAKSSTLPTTTDTSITTQASETVQLQRDQNSLDATATAIINAAQNQGSPIEGRAIQSVRAIINAYYPSQTSKVSDILYNADAGVSGLSTTYKGNGQTLTGIITVGQYFVQNTNSRGFARRVLQVGHELQHIDQQRTGMGGGTKRHEREFLAFYWEATQSEMSGTGRVSHSTRVSLIDEALRNLNCLRNNDDQRYADEETRLRTLRQTEESASGRPPTPVPTECGG